MKITLSILLLGCLSATAGQVPWLAYDTNRCVPYQDNAAITRVAWDWFVDNHGEASCRCDIPNTCESGNWSLRLPECWQLSTGAGVRIEVLDLAAIHGFRVAELCRKVTDGDVWLTGIGRYYPDVVSAAISNAVNNGSRVIVMPFGIVNGSPNVPPVSTALAYGGASNVIFVAAAPFSGVPDWPDLPYLIQVTHGRMDGTINYGFTATGTNLLCCPGRNLVAQGVYYGCNSDASGVCGACVGLVWAKYPAKSNTEIVQLIRSTATEGRINPLAALTPPPLPSTSIEKFDDGSLRVTLLHGSNLLASHDLVNWTVVLSNMNIYGNALVFYDWTTNGAGFFKSQ